MELTVRKMGNSVGVTFPSTVVKDLGWEVGQAMALSTRGGKLVLVPKKPARPTLAELLATCDLKAPTPPVDALWENAKPVGSEAW